jgi:hypothetical protein
MRWQMGENLPGEHEQGKEPMIGKWGSCVLLVGSLALLVGCRTTQPDLKPPKTEEQLVSPPPDARYATSVYPNQAYDQDKTKLTSLDGKGPNGMGMGRGGMGPGAGGVGGMKSPY